MSFNASATACIIVLLLFSGAKFQEIKIPENGINGQTTPHTTTQTTDAPQAELPNLVFPTMGQSAAKKGKNSVLDASMQYVVMEKVTTTPKNKAESWAATLRNMQHYEAIMIGLLLLVMIVEMMLLLRIRFF